MATRLPLPSGRSAWHHNPALGSGFGGLGLGFIGSRVWILAVHYDHMRGFSKSTYRSLCWSPHNSDCDMFGGVRKKGMTPASKHIHTNMQP